MTQAPDLLTAQRAVLQNTQTLGRRGFEVATRLFEFQSQAARDILQPGGASGAWRSAGSGTAANGPQQFIELWSETNAEMLRLLQRQAEGWQSLFNEMLAASLQPSPAFGQTLMAMMTNPFRAWQRVSGGGARRY